MRTSRPCGWLQRTGIALGILVLLPGGCRRPLDAPPVAGMAAEAAAEPTRWDRPLVAMLVPSETGSTNVLDDFEPLFKAVSRISGLRFDLRLGDSYNAVVEAMAAGNVEIAYLGAVTYDEVQRRGVGELLAVEETAGTSVYYAGIFCRADADLRELADLRGRSCSLGDPKSTSSFSVPLAMLVAAGIDPPRDLSRIVMAGSHSASLETLEAGHVDAAAASLNTFDKMVENGAIDAKAFRLIARSDPIPAPPLAMHAQLPAAVKAKLKAGFGGVHQAKEVTPEMILGYGGKQVDRYNTEFDPALFAAAMAGLAAVTDELVGEVIERAGRP